MHLDIPMKIHLGTSNISFYSYSQTALSPYRRDCFGILWLLETARELLPELLCFLGISAFKMPNKPTGQVVYEDSWWVPH